MALLALLCMSEHVCMPCFKQHPSSQLTMACLYDLSLQVAGTASFQAAPVEDYTLHVHVLKTATATAPTHVLVWRPVAVGEVETAADTEVRTFDVGFAATGVSAAWKLSGVVPDGREAAAMPQIAGTTWTMSVSSIPTLVVLA